MTDWLLALVPTYGLWLIAASTFASCVALPIPASILMLAAGGFVASGDLVLGQVILAALSGAVIGDQIGFWLGRRGGAALVDRLSGGPRGRLIGKARSLIERRGALAVFFSRWLFSPLGPYINLIGGAMRQSWGSFTLWAILGEALWCMIYILAGRAAGGNLTAASDMLASVLGLVATGTVVAGLGWWLLRLARRGE